MTKPGTIVALVVCLGLLASVWMILADAAESAVGEISPAEEPTAFIYNPRAKRNPFIPLILPTPVAMTDMGFGSSSGPGSGEDSSGEDPAFLPTPTPIPIVLPPLDLQAILWFGADKRSLAVIDHSLLYEGDSIKNVTIVAIAPQEVRLRYEGHDFNLRTGETD